MHMNHMLLAAGLLGSVPAYAQAPAVGGVPVPLPATITAPLPAGTNPLGSVGVTALPPLPAGNNALGSVGVTALPPLPPGNTAPDMPGQLTRRLPCRHVWVDTCGARL
jgi:hypothetical protein